jgi:Ni/Co efflux regulator RcnB
MCEGVFSSLRENNTAPKLQERGYMKKLIIAAATLALAGNLAATPRQDRDDHHGRDDHHDKDHRGDRGRGHDRDEHHDNGNHNGWYKHGGPDNYAHWDQEHDRIQPGRHYPHGRYEHVRDVFVARSIDYRSRQVVLYDRSNWVVASYDLDRCRDWQWDRDRVYVYDDDHHPGWYLLFNARLGRSVHVEFSGIR